MLPGPSAGDAKAAMLLPQNCQPTQDADATNGAGMSGDRRVPQTAGTTVALPSGSDQRSSPVAPLMA